VVGKYIQENTINKESSVINEDSKIEEGGNKVNDDQSAEERIH
jgi:hypothetical protein